MNIYSILKSRPHNEHYLKRYVKFIQSCGNMEYAFDKEEHHICPKSADLFPEYKDLHIHKWNSVYLTYKQHIIAHIMLSRAYGGLQIVALHYMLNVQNETTEYSDRKIPTCIQIRYAAKARSEFVDWRKNKATYKDPYGNKLFLQTDSPLIDKLNLVGAVKGRIHSDETRKQMSDTKFPNKTVQIYFLNKSTWVKLFSEEFCEFISQGWSTEKTLDDYEYCKELGNKSNSKFWSGRSRYATKGGIYHGAYLHTDPIIVDLGLIQYRTQAQIDQNLSRTSLAAAAKLGKNYYTNGIDEKFLDEPIDDTWVLGRAPRDEEWENKRNNAMREKVVGATTYNNGAKNFFVLPGDFIDPTWIKGMKPQKIREFWHSNGVDFIKLKKSDKIPDGYKRSIKP